MTTSTLTWITEYRRWLSEAESLNNAQLVANFFKGTDWTPEAIAAMCGNMRHESSINPDMYEFGYGWEEDRGYGLVQWTPRSKYWDWAVSLGLDPRSGNSMLARINYEVENNIQWIAKAEIDYMTFAEFRSNAKGWDVNALTEAFTWGYERPNRQAGEDSQPARQAFARRCLAELDWTGTGGGGITPPPSKGQQAANAETQYQYEKAGSWENMTYIKVNAGDTLSGLAAKHGVDMNGIQKVTFNKIIDINALYPGEILLLPNSKTPARVGQVVADRPAYYVVVKGDSLSRIAAEHSTTLDKLATLNNIKNVNLIRVGQKLRIR
jgi:LysM repeat protein